MVPKMSSSASIDFSNIIYLKRLAGSAQLVDFGMESMSLIQSVHSRMEVDACSTPIVGL